MSVVAQISNPGTVDALQALSGNDHIINYWENRRGRNQHLSISSAESAVIGSAFDMIEDITGLRIRRVRRRDEADILVNHGGRLLADGIAGVMVPTDPGFSSARPYFYIAYQLNNGPDSQLTYDDRHTIYHEIAHAFGIDHPDDDGFNPQFTARDTVGSYNDTHSAFYGYTLNDRLALRYLWRNNSRQESVYRGRLDENQEIDWYPVRLARGEVRTIRLDGTTLSDPFLYVSSNRGLSGTLATDDDSGLGLNSALIFSPASSGRYFIGVGAYNGEGTGSYTLNIA
jgi:hypothetical protein